MKFGKVRLWIQRNLFDVFDLYLKLFFITIRISLMSESFECHIYKVLLFEFKIFNQAFSFYLGKSKVSKTR